MKKNLFLFLILFAVAGLVYPQSITVTSPQQGKTYLLGKVCKIEWTKPGCSSPNVIINIFKNSISTANFVLQLKGSNSGVYNWTIPEDFQTGNYALRVKQDPAVEGQEGCVGDSGVFKIAKFLVVPGFEKLDPKKPQFKPKPGMFKPVIDAVLDVPLGALKPGTRLYLKGSRFGTQKGKILVQGNFPGGQFELTDVKWESDTKANGLVPQSVKGQPNQTVGVILMTSYNLKSDPWNMKFEGREEKYLTSNDVSVLHCGNDGNCNTCNQVSICDAQFVAGCSAEFAICGSHINNWGTVGDDVGDDIYSINLKNGWLLKSIDVVTWHKSSGDEVLSGPTPAFPAGSASWSPKIHWKVSPNDHVRYEFKIIVEGPIGTSYK
jgi:hypothetical protein